MLKCQALGLLCFIGRDMCTGPNGVYYDSNSRSFIRLKIDADYTQLVWGVCRKMGVDEKTVRLKITCSYPSVLGNAVSKFMAFDVKDDESLQLILEMASSNTAINSVDLYIEIANIPMAPQTIDD